MKNLAKFYFQAFEGLSTESWMLSLVMLLNRIGSMVIPFLTVYLTSVLGFETEQAGIVMSCFGIGALVGSLCGGWLTDRIGFFYVQFFALLFTVPLFVVLAYITTLTSMCIAVFALSSINECFRPANSAAITAYAKKGNLTRAFSLNRLSINLGFSFGPALGGFLATISYSWLFYGNSIATFVTAIVFYLYFFKRRERNENIEAIASNLPKEEAKFSSPYKDKTFLWFSFFTFLFSCIFFQLLSILPLFYKSGLEFSQVQIGVLLGFNGLFVVFFEMLLVQYAEKKWSISKSIIIGVFFLLISFAWLLIDDSLISCFGSMMFLSLSEMLVLPFVSTVAAERSTVENRGAYMGLNGLSISLAFVIMPYLATKIVTIYSFSHLWSINIIILLISCLGFYFLKNKLVRN